MLLSFNATEWAILIVVALIIGFSRAGVVGFGMLAMPLAVLVLSARQANGFVLPLLAIADVFAIIYWRRHVNWRQLGRLLPWTFIGIIVGFFCLEKITDAQLLPLLALVIIVLLLLNYFLESRPRLREAVPHATAFAAFMGILTGAVSMLAHLGGPLATVYFLSLRFDKKQFIGTGAWFFWIVNLCKMPFSSKLELISVSSLMTNLVLIPFLVLGGVLGLLLIHRISQKVFNRIVYALTFAVAIYLCLTSLNKI